MNVRILQSHLASLVRPSFHDGYAAGFDPEVFVVREDKSLFPAFEFLPSKREPKKFLPTQAILRHEFSTRFVGSNFHAAAYWDGFQAEFTTAPVSCHAWAIDQIALGLGQVLDSARQRDPKATLTIKNVFEFTPEELLNYPLEFVELGCDPSHNAYKRNPFVPNNPFEVPYRMAGGHIHFNMGGGVGLDFEEGAQHAKYLDWLIGIPSVGMFEKFDNPNRRTYYGRAGEFRLPKHGLEYRTLSNAWMGHPSVACLIVDMGRWALTKLVQQLDPEDFGTSFEEIREIIDATDVAGARTVFEKSYALWEVLTVKTYYNPNSTIAMSKAVTEGVQSLIPNFEDIETNWNLRNGGLMHAGRDNNVTASWGVLTRGPRTL